MGIDVGDEVLLRFKDGELQIYTFRQAVERAHRLLGSVAPGRSLSDELIEERHAEAARE